MVTCLKCGNKFHACSNCSLSYDYEYRYCNETCWENSDEYNNAKQTFLEFYNSLNQTQKELFEKVKDFNMDNESEVNTWIEDLNEAQKNHN